MLPWSIDFRGRFDEIVFESEVLKGNRLGDPHQRPLWVYLPPGYDDEPERRYSTIYLIQGLTGQLDMWRNRPPLRKNFSPATGRYHTYLCDPLQVKWVNAHRPTVLP